MRNFKNLAVSRLVGSVTILSMLLLLVAPELANAANITSAKDTATRLAISTTADHVFTFTLPTGVDFDVAGNTDALQFVFPSTFTLANTWQTTDFTFSDSNGSHTVNNVAQGAATIDCTDAVAQTVCVAIDTTNKIFTVKPATTYTASSTGSAITFTVFGTAGTGTGTLTNPASVAATNITVQMCDEQTGCTTTFVATYSDSLAYGIADSDQVLITANVNSTITFDLDTAADFHNDASVAPYAVPLGTLSTATVTHSNDSSIRMIVINGSTNGGGGIQVTVANANGASGLVSAGTPGDTIPSATGTMAAGTPNYGLCVDSATITGFTRQAGTYAVDTCALSSGTNQIRGLTTSPANIVGASAPVSGAKAEVVVNAAIGGATKAHPDYADTLTFIGTGTF
jgi:hypothetical protein